ncbi:SGNH/GDSL hydrolase family protein [Mycoplasma sp. 128]
MDFRDFVEFKDNNRLPIHTKVIDSDLRIVFLGDSISAGFNSKFGFQSCGYLDKEQRKVIGLSYPAYLVRMIEEIRPHFLSSYDNFGFSAITAAQYSELLDFKREVSVSLQNEMDFIRSINDNDQNPFQHELSPYFKNFNFGNGDFDIIKAKIQNANVVVVTLGANDFLAKIPWNLLRNFYAVKNLSRRAFAFSQVVEHLHITSEKIVSDLEQVITKIRALNSETNIVLVGYPLPLIHFKNALDDTFSTTDISSEKMSDIMLGYLNAAIKEAANRTNNMYVDSFDRDFWITNKNFLYENILDIHPTEKGYKHMAQSILLKLGLDDNYVSKVYGDDSDNILNFLPKFNIYKKDFNSYRKIFNLKANSLGLILAVLGMNRGDKLFLDDYYEQEIKNLMLPNYRISEATRALEKHLQMGFGSTLTRYIEKKFASAPQEYKTKQNLLNFLEGKKWSQEIFLTLLENNHVDNFIYTVQTNLTKKNQIAWTDIIESKNNVIKRQNLVYPVAQNLLKAKFINDSKEELWNIVYDFMTEILTTPLLETLINHKLDERYSYSRDYLAQLESFKEFIDFLFNNFMLNIKKYSELRSFDELWYVWLKQNHYKIIFYFDKILKEISSKENFAKSIQFIKLNLFSIYKINFELSEKENAKIERAISNLLYFVSDNKPKLNKLLTMLLQEAQTISIYDYLFSAEKQKRRKMIKRKFFAKAYLYSRIFGKIFYSSSSIHLILTKAKKAHSQETKKGK